MIILTCFKFLKQKNYETNVSDVIKIQEESEHFIFYSEEQDRKCLLDLKENLEKNYNKITDDLNTRLNEKTKVYVYPDIKQLHKAMGDENLIDNIIGCSFDNKIEIVSPLNPGSVHNYSSVEQAVVHEFVHVVVANINNTQEIPMWLNEGIAVYESGQMNDNMKKFITDKVIKNDIPSLKSLNENFDLEKGSYPFSCTIVEYVIKTYGYEKLNFIIKKPDNIENILGISSNEFEEGWKLYVIKYYL